MPVLSPRRSSASTLTGPSYRSTYSSSNLDRPYYGSSNSYVPRINSYSERFTTRSYIDGDGRRVYSRQGSITEDGVTTRFKEEMREGSVRRESISRDSGIGSIRENSILDTPTRRDGSSTRGSESRPRLSAISVAESVAEMRNKYSPSNYVPACLRNNDNVTRSKSINDIGKPPTTTTSNNSVTGPNDTVKSNNAKLKVNGGGFGYSNGLGVTNLPNNTNNGALDDNVALNEDDNGNRASVAEIRKKFDSSAPYLGRSRAESLAVEGTGVKIAENRFKKQDSLDGTGSTVSGPSNKPKLAGGKSKKTATASDVISAINKRNDSGGGGASMLNGHSPVTAKKERLAVNGKSTANAAADMKKPSPKVETGDRAKKTSADTVAAAVTQPDNFDSSPENELKLNVAAVPDETDGAGAPRNGHSNEIVGGCQTDRDAEVDHRRECNGGDRSADDSTDELSRNFNHTSNFASYIPSKNGEQGDGAGTAGGAKGETIDSAEETEDGPLNNRTAGNDMENRNYIGAENRYYQNTSKDLSSSASPRLNRAVSQSAGASSNNYGRASLERDERARGSSPVKNLGLNGLKNIGNTCFMNSVIQCLSNTRLLLEYVKNDTFAADINTSISSMKGALIKAFSQVIKELWSEDSSDRVVNTLSLKSQIQRFAPRFMGYSQQDAQEFLRYLLEGLHEDVNRVTAKPAPILAEIDEKLSDGEKSAEAWQRYLRMDNSKVVDIFVGQLKSTLKCTHCGHCSVTFDPFWDLSLPIPQRAGQQQLRLQQCLDYFTREETLDGDEKPTCSKCKERRKCTKSFTIQKFPKILVIHLKRFSPTERFRGKLSVTIDFPLEGLDMRNYAAESSPAECRYNLYAISNHSGTTYSGHYTAYCRHPYSHAWHEYNDSRVSGISSKALVSGEAYVLFYELDNQKSHL